MTRMTPLLERNEKFARGYTPVELARPPLKCWSSPAWTTGLNPAIVLGLQLGEAPVIRNAGGRVTQAVIADIAYLAFLAEQVFAGQLDGDRLFEVAIIHHTQCGTSFLADPAFRQQAAAATGAAEATLEDEAVADPQSRSRRTSSGCSRHPTLSPKVSVSGHVYEIETGRVSTVLDARYP